MIYQEFNPQRVDVFHDINGHQGTALLTFKNDIHGLEDAQAFEQSFVLANRGSKDWWSQKHPVNLDLYGWQANEAVSNIFHVLIVRFLASSFNSHTVESTRN